MMLGLGSVSVSPTPSLTKTTVGVLPRLHVVGGGALGIHVVSVAPGANVQQDEKLHYLSMHCQL